MGSRIADTLDTGNFVDKLKQQRQVPNFSLFPLSHICDCTPIRVDILPEQRDFLDALACQSGDFSQYVIQRARDLFTTRIRYDAKTAILAAPFHNGDKSSHAFGTCWRQVVEFFD